MPAQGTIGARSRREDVMERAPNGPRHDAIVVGAGIVGLACAWRAAQRGLRVLVLDREGPAAGASGVAAGMLAPVTESDFGEEPLLRLNLAAADAWPGFDAELRSAGGADTGYTRPGALVVAVDRDDAEELRRLLRFRHSLGLDAEWLPGGEARALEPGLTPRAPGAVLAPGEAHVEPVGAIAALVVALEREGGEVRGGVEVSALLTDGDRVVGVETAGGERLQAEHVVLAAGAWSGLVAGLPADARPPVRPVKGQILTLRRAPGAPALAERLVRTPRCYVVPRADGRVVVGATVEERGFDARPTAEAVFRLLEAAREVLPDVDELEWIDARAGLRPGSPDNAPLVGPGALDGLVWATGHHRNGVLLAPLTAEAVAAVLAGSALPEPMRPFSPSRFAPGRGSPPDDAAPAAEVRSGPVLTGRGSAA
jgi:glycine oxidase